MAVAVFAIGLALCCGVAALADGEVLVNIVSVDDSRFPLVTAVFTADEAGRPLGELTPANLVVTESGAAADVVSLTSAADTTIPLALLVTFDTSGSMAGANLVQAKAAAAALFRSLAPTDVGGLITFSDDVRVTVAPGGSPEQLQQAVNGLAANGNTALYDAVAQSGRIVAASGTARRAVVLLSDGEDFGARSQLTREQSLREAASGQALFYVIGIGQQVDRPYLEELAGRSGGRYFQAASASEVPAIYSTIEAFLRSQYVVTIRSSADSAAQLRSTTLAVRTSTGSGTDEAAYQSLRPPPPPVATEPTQAPIIDPAPQTEPTAEAQASGSSIPWIMVLVAGALVAIISVAVWFRARRRRASPVSLPSGSGGGVALPRREPLPSPKLRGTLSAFLGEELVRSLAIDGRPVTIGPGPDCDFRLPPSQLEGTELRLWWRDGSAMAHVLKEDKNPPLLNGAPFRWAALKEGDNLELGPFSLRFSSLSDVSGK